MDKRKTVQALFAFTTNAHVQGFLKGTIYRGKLKNVCVPGLNCYSCPGALGACPIGAMQAVEGTTKYGFSMYVLGFLVFVGLLAGRFVCGWLCPFGLIQELLHKIPLRKIRVPKKVNAVLKWVKYFVLLIFVILLPILTVDSFGLSTPYFCKYICPAGTLEGGLPLLLLNKSLRTAVGFLFSWKLLILILVIAASIVIFRPFCRYLCPLGAFYSFFNSVSLYRYQIDSSKCIKCGKCSGSCKMDIDVCKKPNSPECIRCGACVRACPTGAISGTLKKKEKACGKITESP
ncbi:MAG: 4Fe-4S binding protein [Lachnospiraceae bacterium]|nr:4Fe-4S binding protein [Lachnospiraceae bacterium]